MHQKTAKSFIWPKTASLSDFSCSAYNWSRKILKTLRTQNRELYFYKNLVFTKKGGYIGLMTIR